jgi:hypothetical protein
VLRNVTRPLLAQGRIQMSSRKRLDSVGRLQNSPEYIILGKGAANGKKKAGAD